MRICSRFPPEDEDEVYSYEKKKTMYARLNLLVSFVLFYNIQSVLCLRPEGEFSAVLIFTDVRNSLDKYRFISLSTIHPNMKQSPYSGICCCLSLPNEKHGTAWERFNVSYVNG